MASLLQTQVEHAVGDVLDPCSRLNGTRLSFGELGMIDAVTVGEGGEAHVRLLLDDPTCTYAYDILRDIQIAAGAVEGVTDVQVQIRGDAIWTEDNATPKALAKIAEWREKRLANIAAKCAQACPTCATNKETV